MIWYHTYYISGLRRGGYHHQPFSLILYIIQSFIDYLSFALSAVKPLLFSEISKM